MNALGLLLIGGIAQATVFAVIGSMAYLALRRWSPAAGALAAISGLIIMTLVSMVAVAPLPHGWTITIGQARLNAPAHQTLPTLEFDQGTRPGGDSKSEPAPVAPGEPMLPSPAPRNPIADASTWINSFLSELRQPAVAPERPRWGWPAWIVVGFSASVALGLARLVLGLLSIKRLTATSRPLNDRDLIDEVEVLRAELTCSRKLEIRETSELTTPATIGWRHPLLLLPADWRDWNEPERRAVLSHELAHICRGDFMSGLAGQVSLTLHFYNPLAHWLAARLRLEQELAADAWGARLSGGKQSYLATLAQMALRRESKALTWPARAFLPSRGTFVRRIEMLRNRTQIRHAPLSAVARLLTIGVLCVFGLLVAGLRGPAGVSTAQAQPQQPAARPPQKPANESYNLAFLPADARMIVAVRPRALLERPEMKPLLESIKRSSAFNGVLPVLPEDVEQLLLFWEGADPSERGRIFMLPMPSGAVLRTTKPQDWKSVAKDQHMGSVKEVRHGDQTYLKITVSTPEALSAFAPDDRTLVVAREDLLRELIEDRNAPAQTHPWDAAWNKTRKGQLMVALETRWLRRQLSKRPRGGPSAPGADLTMETISPLLDKAQSYALGIDVFGGLTADLVATARGDDDVKAIADTLQALLTLAANAARANPREFYGLTDARSDAMNWITQARDSLMNGCSVKTEGRFVHLQAKSSVDVAGIVKFLEPAMAAADNASRRKQSVINLKHIALAFHNYHAMHNCFPSPVLYGGATGKVPYSWRVAILPFLENNPLYKQYDFDEPWDGPNNRKLLDKMPAFYSFPLPDGSPLSRTHTAYFVFNGKGTALSPTENVKAAAGLPGAAGQGTATARDPRISPPAVSGPPGAMLAAIVDGPSNTILAVEARRDIPWTKPEDLPFDPDGPLPELGGFSPNGFNAAFTDGAVRFISHSASPILLKALITRAGGEVVKLNDPQITLPGATTPGER